MKNYHFPRWSGPLVGALVGGLCALRFGLGAQIPLGWCVLGGVLMGGLAGAAILLLEPLPREPLGANLPPHLQPLTATNPSGVVGRFLAVAGCLLCWFPILGLVLNLVGFLVNRNSSDWARLASLVGLVIGGCLSTVFLISLATGAIN